MYTLCQFPWHKCSHHGQFHATNSLTTSLWDLAIGSYKQVHAGPGTPLGIYVDVYIYVYVCALVYVYEYITSLLYILACFSDFRLWAFSFCLKYVLLTCLWSVCWWWILHLQNYLKITLFHSSVEITFISLSSIENSCISLLFLLGIEF